MRRWPLAAGAARSGKIRREVSAGGVVARLEGDRTVVALVKTEHKRGLVWVLPKGHVEVHRGERVSAAAGREVREEAGLKQLSVKDQLGVTRFRFQAEDAVIYKTVHYFLMTTSEVELKAQAEEGLLEAAWFPIDEAIQNLAYDTDQEIVKRAKDRLSGVITKRPRPSNRRRTGARIHF